MAFLLDTVGKEVRQEPLLEVMLDLSQGMEWEDSPRTALVLGLSQLVLVSVCQSDKEKAWGLACALN